MSKPESSTNAEGRRPDFEARKYLHTEQPNPAWKPGQGLNGRTDLPGYQAFVEGATLTGSQENFRHINPDEVEDKLQLYKLMIGGIVPRPIAFCSTISPSGVLNLAPFSYFTPLGSRPPMLTIYFSCTKPLIDGVGQHRDTLINIKHSGEFVVNMISEPFAEASNFTAIDSPEDVSEWDLSGLTPVPSDVVKPPRVGESAFSMECTLDVAHDIYSDDEKLIMTGTFVVGRIRRFHARKDLFGSTGAIEPSRLLPVSCLGGTSYARSNNIYDMPRPGWNTYKDDEAVKSIVADAKAKRVGGRRQSMSALHIQM